MPSTDLRLKHSGVGFPADYPDPAFRTSEGRPFPRDILRGYKEPPELSFSPDGRVNSGRWKFRISPHWIKRFVANFIGYGAADGTGLLNRVLPLNDPDGYGMVGVGVPSVAYANESGYNPATRQIDPKYFQQVTEYDPSLEDGEARKKYRYAIVTCEFAHVPYHIATNADVGAGGDYGERARYMTTVQTASNEYVSLDRAVIFWNDAANPAYIANANAPIQVATGGGFIRAISEIVTTWYRVPIDALTSLIGRWRPQLGHVNSKDLLLPFFNTSLSFPAETCLFQPWRLQERMGPLGSPEYTVELRWLYRDNRNDATDTIPKGWNHFLYPPDGKYYRVSWGDSIAPVRPIYALADQDLLFKAS